MDRSALYALLRDLGFANKGEIEKLARTLKKNKYLQHQVCDYSR